MSDKNLHSEFDNAFRKRFEHPETIPAPSLWQNISEQIKSSENLTFDNQINLRLQGGTISPPKALKKKILDEASGGKTPFTHLPLSKGLGAILMLISFGVVLFYLLSEQPTLSQNNIKGPDSVKHSPPLTDTHTVKPHYNSSQHAVESGPLLEAKNLFFQDTNSHDRRPLLSLSNNQRPEVPNNRDHNEWTATGSIQREHLADDPIDLLNHTNGTLRIDSIAYKNQIGYTPQFTIAKAVKPPDKIHPSGSSSPRLSINLMVYPGLSSTFIRSDEPITEEFYHNNQQDEWALGGEFRVSYKLNKRWSLSTGVGTARYSSKINIENREDERLENIEMDSRNQSIIFYSSLRELRVNNLDDFNFDIRPLPGGDTINEFTYREKQTFSFLQVPLLMQYSIQKGQFQGVFSGGPLVSFVTASRSNIEFYNTEDEARKILIDNYHESNGILFGMTARVGAAYALSPKLSIQIEPTINYSFSNLNRFRETTLKLYDFRLSTGFMYKF